MTLAELRREIMLVHRAAAARAGAEPQGMREAIEALPDLTMLRAAEGIPGEVIEMIERDVRACSDYKEPS